MKVARPASPMKFPLAIHSRVEKTFTSAEAAGKILTTGASSQKECL